VSEPSVTESEATARRWRPITSGRFISFAAGFLLALASVAAVIGLAPAPLRAYDATASQTDSIFTGNQTIIGQTIAYPAGTPMLRTIILTVPPGGQNAWHSHETPVFGYMLEGELTIDYGSKGVKVYRAGDALLEAVDWPHQASNRGTVPARILAVNIGTGSGAFAVPAAGAK